MTARSVYIRTLRTFRARAGFLLLLGAVVFIPLGLLEAVGHMANEISLANPDEVSGLGGVAIVVAILVQGATTMLGEVFYSGAVALSIARGEPGQEPSLRSLARRLAYRRLIVVDLLFTAGTAIGLLALVVPGLVFFTWFALAGPVVELEQAGVRAAFARSRALVRGHFRLVFAVLVPITLTSELIADLVLEGANSLLDSPFLGDWAGETAANILVSPFYAVAAVLLTLRLSASSDRKRTSSND